MRSLLLALILSAAAACTSDPPPIPALRLGTTHTVEQSGALALLDSLEPPVRVATIVAPSGQILRAAAEDNLDVILTHAPTLEQRLLVAPGRAAERCPFVSSRFAIVGPPGDPARVREASDAADAMRRIARLAQGDRRPRFVSRGDSSGTHVKELALWSAAGTEPGGHPWYVEAGSDQAATLRVADERGAYALADLPTFQRLTGTELAVLFTADSALINTYTLYVVRSPTPHPAAASFVRWAMGTWRARLADLGFAPLRGACATGDAMVLHDLVPRVGVTLVHHGAPVLGEREAQLLGAIERVGSIKDAAKEAGISYRTAWGALQDMERTLGRPLVESQAGGLGGGRTRLTEDCRRLLELYRQVRDEVGGDVARMWRGAVGDAYRTTLSE